MIGQVVKVVSNINTVSYEDKLYECMSRGLFRKKNIKIRVGDYVKFDENNIIYELIPRKNEFVRPFVSNIDQSFIVTSIKEPELSLNLLDKFLVLMEYKKVDSVICLTKLDLLNDEEIKELNKLMNYYKNIGYIVVDNVDVDNIKPLLKNKTTVFTGQTGVGKSTLLNKLDPKLNLATNEISKALGRGKHTTRHVELINVSGGKVLDTPGFSSFSFDDLTKEQVRDNFVEFREYECRFRDCFHINEIGCKVKDALDNKEILNSRYENYIKIVSEVK